MGILKRMPRILVACVASSLSAVLWAQGTTGDYANRTVRIIVSQAIGGAVDAQARIFLAKLGESLGGPFVLEHRNGIELAWPLVTRAAPDGYTLMAIAPDIATTPTLKPELGIDPIKSFAPISLTSQAPYFISVNPVVPAKSIQELIRLGRANPGKLNFAGGLHASGSHLVAAWFISAAQIKATYVPYKGATQSLTDLIAGRLDAAIATGNALPHARSGKLRILGTTLAQRSKLLPDVPTIAEQGLPSFATSTYRGLVAPAGTPPAIVNRLATEIARIAQLPEVVKSIAADGSEPITTTPDETRRFIAEDIARWRKVIIDNQITGR